MAAMPVALFGALEHGQARIAHPEAPRTASEAPPAAQVGECDSQEPVAGESKAGSGALPNCNGTASDPSRRYREVWAGGTAVDFGDSR